MLLASLVTLQCKLVTKLGIKTYRYPLTILNDIPSHTVQLYKLKFLFIIIRPISNDSSNPSLTLLP